MLELYNPYVISYEVLYGCQLCSTDVSFCSCIWEVNNVLLTFLLDLHYFKLLANTANSTIMLLKNAKIEPLKLSRTREKKCRRLLIKG